MRKFFFENSIGERVDLQSDIRLHTPSGLGVSNESTYGRVSDGFHALTYSTLAQGNIVGELVFKHGYSGYTSFMNWLYKGYDIKLVYAPVETEYSRDVELEYLQKTELTTGGWLICPISMLCKSPWYKNKPLQVTLAKAGNFAIYPFKYGSLYPISSAENSVDITPVGHLSAAIHLEAPGPFMSPEILLTKGSTVIGKCALAGIEIDDESKLVYSSRIGSMGIWSVKNGVKTSLLDYIDLADNNFFSIPVNAPCTLSISSDTTIINSASVSVYEYFKAV